MHKLGNPAYPYTIFFSSFAPPVKPSNYLTNSVPFRKLSHPKPTELHQHNKLSGTLKANNLKIQKFQWEQALRRNNMLAGETRRRHHSPVIKRSDQSRVRTGGPVSGAQL